MRCTVQSSRPSRAISAAGIRVSLFVDPEEQLDAAVSLGAPLLNCTPALTAVADSAAREAELERIEIAAAYGEAIGLECHAGHGLSFDTVKPIAAMPTIAELNIGHFLIGEAILAASGTL